MLFLTYDIHLKYCDHLSLLLSTQSAGLSPLCYRTVIFNVGGTSGDLCCLIPCCPGNSPSSEPGVKNNCVSAFPFYFFVKDYFSPSDKTQVSGKNPLLSSSSQYPLLTIFEAPEEGQRTPKSWPRQSGNMETEDAQGFKGGNLNPVILGTHEGILSLKVTEVSM